MERVQFITHFTERYSYIDSARMALEGGCRWIQLRMKQASDRELLCVAGSVGRMCREFDAVFIVDDNVEVAMRVGADGVHLGRNDMPVAQARALLGSEFIIGATANTFDDVAAHHRDGADYIGCGPFRFTATKSNLSPVLGLTGYKTILARMRENNIRLPLVAIGGIGSDDIADLMRVGVNGVALSGSVLRAENPVEEMKTIINIMERWKN